MKCLYCDYAAPESALRCPNCRNALTVWKNYDQFAEASFRAGWEAHEDGRPNTAADCLLRAVVFNPEHPAYLYAYALSLLKMSRLDEAHLLLERLEKLQESSRDENSLRLVVELRKLVGVPASVEAGDSPQAAVAVAEAADADASSAKPISREPAGDSESPTSAASESSPVAAGENEVAG